MKKWIVVAEANGAINLLKKPGEDIVKLKRGDELDDALLGDFLADAKRPVSLKLICDDAEDGLLNLLGNLDKHFGVENSCGSTLSLLAGLVSRVMQNHQ